MDDNGTEVSAHRGFPNPATDSSLQGLDLNKLLIQHGASTFAMRIEGDEWNEQGIFAGDIVLIDRSLDAISQDIVVWWHEDTFAISRLKQIPKEAVVWGVVSTIIHQTRGDK